MPRLLVCMISGVVPYVKGEFHLFLKKFCRAENTPEKWVKNNREIHGKMNASKPVQQPEQGRFFLFWLILYLYIIYLSYIVGIMGKPIDK